jgi:hypothetical protein
LAIFDERGLIHRGFLVEDVPGRGGGCRSSTEIRTLSDELFR